MTPIWNIQSDIAALREEMQRDRQAMQSQMTQGFAAIHTQIDDKVGELADKFSDVDARVGTLETTQTLLGRGVSGIAITIFGGAVAWVFSLFGK